MDILITIHKRILPEEIKFFKPQGNLSGRLGPRAWRSTFEEPTNLGGTSKPYVLPWALGCFLEKIKKNVTVY